MSSSRMVSEEMAEKIRLLLVAKRKDLVGRQYLEQDEEETTLIEWVML